MAQLTNGNGDIETYQGDTFYIYLTLTQEETQKKGTLFVQFTNSKRQMMLPNEIQYNVVPGETDIAIPVSSANSDLLVVKKNEDYAEYQYAVKHCSSLGIEDTWIIGGTDDLSDLPTVRVHPKYVNGGIGTDVATYTYWTATEDETVYRGKTLDGNSDPTVFILEEPELVAGEYPVASISTADNFLTITTSESIPTTYYKEGTEPSPEPTPEPEDTTSGGDDTITGDDTISGDDTINEGE